MQLLNWDTFLLPYRQTVDELCLKLSNIKREYEGLKLPSPFENVYGRVKSVGSILDKAERKNIPIDQIANKIEDIAGVRIICRFVEDIPKIVELLRQREHYDLRIQQERDYINNTKPSGYRSYHILVKYNLLTRDGVKDMSGEIQIRTLAMDFWATIEHSLNYKYSGNMPSHLKDRLIASAEAAFLLDKEMSTIRDEIMEAQKIIQVKTDLVNDILQNIQKLYFTAKLETVNAYNAQFIELYQADDLERLIEFNRQLKVLAELYKAY